MTRRMVAITLSIGLLVLAFGAGLATQRYVLAEDKGPRAECIILSNQFKDFTYVGGDKGSATAGDAIDEYNRLCR